jgi:hypothetical protein
MAMAPSSRSTLSAKCHKPAPQSGTYAGTKQIPIFLRHNVDGAKDLNTVTVTRNETRHSEFLGPAAQCYQAAIGRILELLIAAATTTSRAACPLMVDDRRTENATYTRPICCAG